MQPEESSQEEIDGELFDAASALDNPELKAILTEQEEFEVEQHKELAEKLIEV